MSPGDSRRPDCGLGRLPSRPRCTVQDIACRPGDRRPIPGRLRPRVQVIAPAFFRQVFDVAVRNESCSQALPRLIVEGRAAASA